MLVNPPVVYRKRPGRVKVAAAPPPAPLVLLTGVYDSSELTLTLTFDRAIDISAFFATQISVNDPVDTLQIYVTTGGAELIDDTVLELGLDSVGNASGMDVIMQAENDTGIVAVDNDVEWAGARVGLPFP